MTTSESAPDPTAGERIKAGRIKHGVGSSDHLAGNVCHLVSPIVGFLRLNQRDGEAPSADDVDWFVDRLSLVLDLAREAEAHPATPDADPTAGEHGCRWSASRGRWETALWPGVSKEACGHLSHTRGDEMYLPDEPPRPATPDADDASTEASEPLTEAIGMSLYESLMEASADEWRRWEFMTDAAKEKYRSEAARIIAAAVEPHVAARETAAATKARAEGWDVGYQRGLRDAEEDVQHGADNPYREQA